MSWNVRVMRHRFEVTHGGEDEILEFHEVHYDAEGKVKGWSTDPIGPHGETIEELRASVAMYVKALDKPVLEYSQRGEPDAETKEQ